MCKTEMIDCPECGGEGTVEYEVAVPMSFSNGHGFLEVGFADCENCKGSGQIEADWEDE